MLKLCGLTIDALQSLLLMIVTFIVFHRSKKFVTSLAGIQR